MISDLLCMREVNADNYQHELSLVCLSAMQDARSNWMEGYLCMSVYLIIAVAVSIFSALPEKGFH